jgi:hypothetical protein
VGVGHSLDPRRSSADEDEREKIVGDLALQPLGLFEAVYYGVANPQGVPQPLEVYGVLAGTRGAKESRTAARSQDELVVGERSYVRADLPSLEVYPLNLRLEELCQVPLATPSAERVDRWKRAAELPRQDRFSLWLSPVR